MVWSFKNYVLHRPPPPPYQTKWTQLSLLPAEAYSPPAQPRPNLNAVPHICTNMTLGCAFKAATKVAPSFASRRLPLPPAAYISLHCTVTPTAPPDCSQTRLKNDSDSDSDEPIWLYGLWEETKTLPPPQPLLPNVCSCSQSFPKVSPLPYNVCNSYPMLPQSSANVPQFSP